MDRWAERELAGWGRMHRVTTPCCRPERRAEVQAALQDRDGRPVLAFGKGRSYGDVAVVQGGRMVLTERLDHLIDFDPATGWLRCEGGVGLDEIIAMFMPRGWFPPVVPGTRFVTVAGAVANDIHGKNHHVDGTFADHVRRVELLTAKGEVVICDAQTEPELFWATVGGIGLTGIILTLELRLVPIATPYIDEEQVQVRNLDHFFEVSDQSSDHTHTVSWVDCTTTGRSMGRGIFMRGTWSDTAPRLDPTRALRGREPLISVPANGPNWLLNRLTTTLFNSAFYRKQRSAHLRHLVHYEPFFFPLDAVGDWNRLYGSRGFLQYQLVVPHDPERRAIRAVLEEVTRSKMASFLVVMKEFGDRDHGGISFPTGGVTLAMDFPNLGQPLLDLCDRLDRIVLDAGGRLYLGKDSRMSRDTFRAMYPSWQAWKATRDAWDPDNVFQSELGRRLGLCGGEA